MTVGEYMRINTKFREEDMWRFPEVEQPCWVCENPGTDEKPVVMFMGRPGHVRCIQRHANRDIMGQTLR